MSGIGNMPIDYRSDGSFNPADQRTVESILFALEALHGGASTWALASHMQSTMNRIEPVLDRMRKVGLVKYEVVRPGERDGIEWRRTKAGIEMAAAIEMRQRARRH